MTLIERPRQEDTLKSMVKMLRILECFSTKDRKLSPSEIARRTGLPNSTAHRIAATLREIGFLDQDRGRDEYRLGLKLFELGSTVLANMDLHREARPVVDALAALSGEVVHLAVFDGARAVIISRSEPDRERVNPVTILESAPAYCTACGKAALAFQGASAVDKVIALGLVRFTRNTITEPKALLRELATIRKRGYALDREEHQLGLRCVGAPILDVSGRVFAALSVSGPRRRVTEDRVEELSELVIHHADTISAQLGYRAEPVPARRPDPVAP